MGFRKNKKKSAPEQPNLALPPAPLPPMPGMPLPLPNATSMPPLPTPAMPAVPEPKQTEETAQETQDKEDDYNELWAKKVQQTITANLRSHRPDFIW